MNSSLLSSTSRLHQSSAASPSSSMISESSIHHHGSGDEGSMFFKNRMSSSALNSSVSSQASTSSRWEEMKYLAKEIHDNAIRKTTGSRNERSKLNYDNDDSFRQMNTFSRDSGMVLPSSRNLIEHTLSDTLDSASSILQKYIDKYNCRATTSNIDLDDSLTDLYSRLSDGFPNTTTTNPPVTIKNTPNYLLDSSISSVAPLKSVSANPMDDLLSICSRSTITTNSDELFSKLDHYSKKYNEKKKEPMYFEVKSKKSKSSDSIFDSDKENFIPNKGSKTKKKSTTPTKRPQSVKVSTLRESSSETNRKRSKTPSKSSTARSVATTCTATSTNSSSTNKYTSTTRKPPVPKFTKSSTTTQSSNTKKSNKGSASSTVKSSTRAEDISDISSLSEDDEKMESKSCQTSMIHTCVDTMERPSSGNTMTTLASISSSGIHSSSSPMIGSTNEIAFKIVGSTENIEKVEVYLKNSQKQSYSCSSSNASVTSEKLDPASDLSGSFNLNVPEEDVSNTLKPLKSLYSKYFTQ
ncbi:hypothetical protein FDP41_000582 [Naegleria fowleri]|uniref:Uncharacterized protein n=1 Tax=Naegleria fowleri TaxID=5763 RepID=A0A6A5C2N1_NAEFO|nr:uncharacterized protein FDP41_000582 [Naegleria fowleri]KAF0984683.1 hypothetical protein FDP41_000582 [Naegleria fowleri]CAG4709727.1 unnamed protein product [Naegleria fowleri]